MSTLSLEQWKEWAIADARRRGLDALEPLLQGLAAATSRLRATEWHATADRLSRAATLVDGEPREC